MGTNYYLIENTCPHCGRSDERRHIGKSSAGWCFSLCVGDGVKSLADWQEKWSKPGAKIVNEYGDTITPDEILKTITQRKWHGHATDDPAWLLTNDAEVGPAGLALHQIGGFCIGHGEGTYDLVRGEFS